MKWKSLISIPNLTLAWRRINTAKNVQYKRYFRDAYLVYEACAKGNIKELHRALEANAWTPHHATRIYLPKASGLQRPLSLLDIEDQIMIQALANKVATKLRPKRAKVEMKSVFSNRLGDSNSIFFTQNWTTSYPLFHDRCKTAYRDGFRWAAHFDLAAYYDTISHELLLSIVSVDKDEPQTLAKLKEWLRIWSADNEVAMKGHGIPQGPAAADFLAEAFFLPIDLQLQNSTFVYARYVDDIRLFGKTETEVREAAVTLEQECRHRGLIPQSTKFSICELRSIEEAAGSLPSIPTTVDASPYSVLTEQTATRLLQSSVSGKPLKVNDKSRFRYIMYRAPANRRVLDLTLRLLPRHPEHIDAFVAFFGRYETSSRTVKAAIRYLESGTPYSYVRGELWHLIARLGNVELLRAALPIALQDARRRKKCIALSWGVMHFLMRSRAEGLVNLGRRLTDEHPISLALLAPLLPNSEFLPNGVVASMLKGRLCEQFAAVRELQARKIRLNRLGLRQRVLPDTCKRALVGLGVASRRDKISNRDWIAISLRKLYGCNGLEIWRTLLSSEYEHAHQILIEAQIRLKIDRSGWLNQQDSFNDAMIRQFFDFLRLKGLPGYSTSVSPGGILVDYGSLLQTGGPFDVNYPIVAAALRRIHERRNRLPSSHPYHKRGGSRNQYLAPREQRTLLQDVRNAIDALAETVYANL